MGLEVFDVLTLFFSSFDTEYIVLPFFYRLSYFLSKMGQLLLSFQEWLLRIMKSRNTLINIVVSSWLPVFFEKDLVGIPNFVNISIECMVVLPVRITKTET